MEDRRNGQVLVAFDRLTSDEQARVVASVQAFERREAGSVRLPGAEPLYVLHAAPEVLVIVRKEPGAAVEVEDIVRPATLRNLAYAG